MEGSLCPQMEEERLSIIDRNNYLLLQRVASAMKTRDRLMAEITLHREGNICFGWDCIQGTETQGRGQGHGNPGASQTQRALMPPDSKPS